MRLCTIAAAPSLGLRLHYLQKAMVEILAEHLKCFDQTVEQGGTARRIVMGTVDTHLGTDCEASKWRKCEN